MLAVKTFFKALKLRQMSRKDRLISPGDVIQPESFGTRPASNYGDTLMSGAHPVALTNSRTGT